MASSTRCGQRLVLAVAPRCFVPPLYDMAGSTILAVPSPAFAPVEPRGTQKLQEEGRKNKADERHYLMCTFIPDAP